MYIIYLIEKIKEIIILKIRITIE